MPSFSAEIGRLELNWHSSAALRAKAVLPLNVASSIAGTALISSIGRLGSPLRLLRRIMSLNFRRPAPAQQSLPDHGTAAASLNSELYTALVDSTNDALTAPRFAYGGPLTVLHEMSSLLNTGQWTLGALEHSLTRSDEQDWTKHHWRTA